MNRKLNPSDSIAFIAEFVVYTYLKASALWSHSGQDHFHCFPGFHYNCRHLYSGFEDNALGDQGK